VRCVACFFCKENAKRGLLISMAGFGVNTHDGYPLLWKWEVGRVVHPTALKMVMAICNCRAAKWQRSNTRMLDSVHGIQASIRSKILRSSAESAETPCHNMSQYVKIAPNKIMCPRHPLRNHL
jgi:hypothetical protein